VNNVTPDELKLFSDQLTRMTTSEAG
jgi:hypothetical protein